MEKTGLANLGNTCFMNSALQCLLHSVPLTKYFLTQEFQEEINETNRLGTGGKFPREYHKVVQKVWLSTKCAPRNFKQIVSTRNPIFEGYGQQDSHELLLCVLDGLHEDLNRIRIRENSEYPEQRGMSDDEYAAICWADYKSRNDSVIVDLFQGLLKSRTKCEVCSRTGLKFDPYMYLQLPIPENPTVSITVTCQDINQKLSKMELEVKRHTLMVDIPDIVSQKLGWNGTAHICEIFNHKVYKNFQKEDVNQISPQDIILVSETVEEARLNEFRDGNARNITVSACLTAEGHMNTEFGIPLVLEIPSSVVGGKETEIGNVFYEIILEKIRNYSKVPLYRRKGSNILMQPIVENLADTSAPRIEISENDVSQEKLEGFEVFPDICSIVMSQGGRFYRKEQVLYPPTKVSPSNAVAQDGEEELKNVYHNVESYKFEDDVAFTIKFTRQVAEFLFGSSVLMSYSSSRGVFDPTVLPSSPKAEGEMLTLQRCMQEFTKIELMTDNDSIYCPSCKQHQPTTKQLEVYTLPQILVIQLKRFGDNHGYRSKIDSFIDVPEVLDMGNMIGKPNLYDLFGVSNHYGGMGGGHYTAYVKDVRDNRWYDADDSHVSPLNGPVITKAAYLLFYRRRDDILKDEHIQFEKILEDAKIKMKEAQMDTSTVDQPIPKLAANVIPINNSNPSLEIQQEGSFVVERADGWHVSSFTINDTQDSAHLSQESSLVGEVDFETTTRSVKSFDEDMSLDGGDSAGVQSFGGDEPIDSWPVTKSTAAQSDESWEKL